MKKGPGTNKEQIEALEKGMGESPIKEAHSIMGKFHPDVITLAYKLMRVNVAKNKLPKAVTKLLDGLPKEDAEVIRGKLVQAHQGPTKVNVRDGGPRHMP